MIGFTQRIVRAVDLEPGTRVQWWGDTLRTVESVAPMGDGTDHLRVAYTNETSSRYAGNGLVRCLEICPVPVMEEAI